MSTSPIYNQILSESSIGSRCHRPGIIAASLVTSDDNIFSSAKLWTTVFSYSLIAVLVEAAFVFCGVGSIFCDFTTPDTLIDEIISMFFEYNQLAMSKYMGS